MNKKPEPITVQLTPAQAVITEGALCAAVRAALNGWYKEHQGLTPDHYIPERHYLQLAADCVTAGMAAINLVRAAQHFGPWPITTVCSGMDDELHAWTQR